MKIIKSLGIVLCLLLSFTAVAATVPDHARVVVTGSGEVEATPDIARLQLQINDTRDSAATAKKQVDGRVEAVLNAARQQGIASADIRASQIRVFPDYEWRDGKRILKGQRVERQIDITLRDLSRYGALVDQLVKAGVDELGQVHFDIARRDRLTEEAMQKAIADATRQATALAEGFGSRLGSIYRISSSGDTPVFRPERAMMMDAKVASTPVMLGSETIRAQVNAVFLLK